MTVSDMIKKKLNRGDDKLDKFMVCLITDGKEETVPMSSDEILELASLIQGDQYQGKVPMTIKCDDDIKQCVVLGFIIYGKAIHDYSKIIYFVNKSI